MTTVKITENTVAIIKETLQGPEGPGGSAEVGVWGSSSEVTIVSGVAALSGEGYYGIDTESDDASDALTQVTGLVDGDEIILKPENDARTVVVTHGTNLKLSNGANFTMNSAYDRIRLQCIGSDTCVELSRSSNGS